MYIGVLNNAKKVNKIYVGYNNQPYKIIKAYVGVNKSPILFYNDGEEPIHLDITDKILTTAAYLMMQDVPAGTNKVLGIRINDGEEIIFNTKELIERREN